MRLPLPHPVILRPYMARGLRLWVAVRVTLGVVGVITTLLRPEDVLWWDPGVALGVLTLCAVLSLVDARRRGERALLANLGVSEPTLVLVFLAPAAAGELAFALLSP